MAYCAVRGQEERPDIFQREDGSWLVDGMLNIHRLMQQFDLDGLSEERNDDFHTVGGFVMLHLGHVPIKQSAQRSSRGGYHG